jgi:phage gpG-like protein
MVTVGTTLPYAKIHNDGGVIAHPGGTAYFKTKDGKLAWVSNQTAARLASAGRKMPRTKPHAIRMPQRKFLGKSVSLNQKLRAIVTRELARLTNNP